MDDCTSNQTIKQIFSTDNMSQRGPKIPSPDATPFQSMSEIEVTKESVVKLLLNLNPNKASGPDLLPAMVLNEMAIEIDHHIPEDS